MKIDSVEIKCGKKPRKVVDSFVDDGYRKTMRGSLPDIDTDFDADKRPEVKAYLERRYNHDGKQRVFSAGTFTTEQIRSVIKDVCRVHRVSANMANYITAIIDSGTDWTGLMQLAVKEKKVRDFIEKHWDVFEEIRPIMFQPRSPGVHASALVITPDIIEGEDVECFDIIPIKKMDGLLVSELSGVELDELGLLKNDVLGIAELSRLDEMIQICNNVYQTNLSIEGLATSSLDEPKVFEIINKGLTQGIFQLSSVGMTRFVRSMHPDCINDVIAANALFRPATLDSGAAGMYVDAKNGTVDPEYLWGTYDILKDTYAVAAYQEQYAALARSIGGLSLGDGVNLVKAISKKKVEKIRKFKDKFYAGAQKKGCPDEVRDRVWSIIEGGATYGFNKSHATAYGITAYIGAYIKALYPTAFYTVLLKWGKDENIPAILAEMRELGNITITHPDINVSTDNFETDYETNEIYWSLLRIKFVGVSMVDFIVKNRNRYGKFMDLEDFITRIFKHKFKKYKSFEDEDNEEEYKRCPVTAKTVKNLIMAGAFDKVENVGSVTERYGLLKHAAELLGFEIKEKEVPQELRDKHWFWSQQQINLSGIGSVDYERIYKNETLPSSMYNYTYFSLDNLQQPGLGDRKVGVCATIAEVEERSYKDKKTGEKKYYGKILLQQNIDTATLVIWHDTWMNAKQYFMHKKDSIVIFAGNAKWSDYDEKNILQINKGSYITNI